MGTQRGQKWFLVLLPILLFKTGYSFHWTPAEVLGRQQPIPPTTPALLPDIPPPDPQIPEEIPAIQTAEPQDISADPQIPEDVSAQTTEAEPQATASGSSTYELLSGMGPRAVTRVQSMLPTKVQVGLGAGFLGTTLYSRYLWKRRTNFNKAKKDYQDFIPIVNSNQDEDDKKTSLFNAIKNRQEIQNIRNIRENFRTPEQNHIIEFPFTTFKLALEDAIESLGTGSWIALTSKETRDLENALHNLLDFVKNLDTYKAEESRYAAYQTRILLGGTEIKECYSRITSLIQDLNKAQQQIEALQKHKKIR